MRKLTRSLATAAAAVLTATTMAACSSSDAENADGAASGEGPQNIVLTGYAAANILDDLELEDRVVAMTKGTNLPDILSEYDTDEVENVGSLKEPDMAKIAELGPDAVFTGRRTEAMIPEFEKLSDDVMNADPDQTDLVATNRDRVTELAKKFGPEVEAEATEKLDAIDEKVAEVKGKAEGAGTALVIMTSGGKVTAFGPGSGYNIIYQELGFEPVTEINNEGNRDPHGAPMSWEEIAELNPDHIFVLDRDSAIGQEGESAEAMLDNPVFNSTKAAQEGGVHYLNTQNWYLVSGGLSALDAMIDDVAAALD